MKENQNLFPFRNQLAQTVFQSKYALFPGQTWAQKSKDIVQDVCRGILPEEECDYIEQCIATMKFIPGGRYIYYAGRPIKAFNNCFLLRAEEDTREEWAQVKYRATSCLMTGGGIGIDYSILRGAGRTLSRTGGKASGPIPLMHSIDQIGTNIMQGGSRRSAIYASLNWRHSDIPSFLVAKNWKEQRIEGAFDSSGNPFFIADAKNNNFNYKAPLDMTNISINYDNQWLNKVGRSEDQVFLSNCYQALSTGEPGFSFNFGDKENETLRNACTEVTSEDDSDVCNLGSINLANIHSIDNFRSVVSVATKFLVCGTLRSDLPYEKVFKVREKNRRLGLGLMGIHEWLIRRGMKYEVTPELHEWLAVYNDNSNKAAYDMCDRLGINRPVGIRAIAPTGSIGILAGTTTGIEPLFAVAYKRRYLEDGRKWKYQYVIDTTADAIINSNNGFGFNGSEKGLDNIFACSTAYTLASTPELRIRFQADVQDYVDQSISSTLNLPSWGSVDNNPDTVRGFASLLARYAPRLRGFTCYPSGSRGGQPLEPVEYDYAKKHEGVVYEENDSCKGGVCGI